MPIYEYRCEECNAIFSKLRSMRDADAPLECVACHGEHVRRQLSRVAATRRGDGGDGAAGGSSCSGCSSHNCGSCGH